MFSYVKVYYHAYGSGFILLYCIPTPTDSTYICRDYFIDTTQKGKPEEHG